jgi:hypothetical protein
MAIVGCLRYEGSFYTAQWKQPEIKTLSQTADTEIEITETDEATVTECEYHISKIGHAKGRQVKVFGHQG